MKLKVEQIGNDKEEAVIVQCHNREATWVQNIREAAFGQITVCGYKDNVLYRLRLSDIFYFEVVDGASFLYTKIGKEKCDERDSVLGTKIRNGVRNHYDLYFFYVSVF